MPVLICFKQRMLRHTRFFPVVYFILPLLIACTNQPATTILRSDAATDTLLQADAVLHQRLQAVLDADAVYAQQAAQAAPTATLDAANEQIAAAEIALQKTIDSIAQLPIKSTAADGLQRIIGSFKSVLQSRRSLYDLRMVVSANSDDSTSMQHTLTQLRAAVQEKDKKIAALARNQTSASPAQGLINKEDVADTQTNRYAPARGENLADLRQRNKNLTLAYGDLQVKYFVLGKNYLVLKQEHERTLKELATQRQPGNQ